MWIIASVSIQSPANQIQHAQTCAHAAGRVTVALFSGRMNVSGASLSSEHLLFSLSIPPSTVIFTLCSGWAVRLHLRDTGPLSLFLPQIFKSQIEILIFRVNPETTNKTSDYYCLFGFHPPLFVLLLQFLSRLFLAAALPISAIFVFLLSAFWSFESPLSSVSHHHSHH